MFSTRLARVANRTCASAAASNASSTTAARATQSLAARQRPHQRRHSSSKASSCPPDSSANGGKPAPAAKADAGDKASLANPTAPQHAQRGTKKLSRAKRSRPAVGTDKVEDQFAGLPAVPHTQHLDQRDLSVSSFFSLHRPLSIATTIPPPSTADAFDSIFHTRQQRDPWENGNSAERRPEDVVYALGNLFENLDVSTNEAQDDGVRWEIISEGSPHQDGVRHLDGPPRMKSLDDMVAQFKPFQVPPPPQQFEDEPKQAEKKRVSKPRQKRYATTIFLTESTGTNGQVTYTTSTSPVVQVPLPEEAVSVEGPAPTGTSGRTFRERLQQDRKAYFLRQKEQKLVKPTSTTPIRQAPSAARKDPMMLISVKRQRKLKMKKHKYKKLMKRTRNLRRRQDRA